VVPDALRDQALCLLVGGCVIEAADQLTGGTWDCGRQVVEQRGREARSALAAAEEDHARGDGLKRVDGVLIQGGDLLVLGEGLSPAGARSAAISFTYQSGMRSRAGGARPAPRTIAANAPRASPAPSNSR
jgi:hypothetical protein